VDPVPATAPDQEKVYGIVPPDPAAENTTSSPGVAGFGEAEHLTVGPLPVPEPPIVIVKIGFRVVFTASFTAILGRELLGVVGDVGVPLITPVALKPNPSGRAVTAYQ
jgi:hypothetical protein